MDPAVDLSPGNEAPAGCSPSRILFIEDHPGDAELLESVLTAGRSDGAEIVRATGLEDALRELDAGSFCVIILDLGSPDSHGVETFTRIQRRARGIPIIVLSGLNDLELSTQVVRRGAQDCLPKSILCGELLIRAIRFAAERHRILLEAAAQSLTDDLTGLFNRRGLTALANPWFEGERRHSSQFVLLYLDLDGLKPINDSLGHRAGDHALVETARVLRGAFREADLLARMGGDEFAVLTIGTPPERAPDLVRRLREQFDRLNAQPARQFELSASIGAVPFDPARHSSLEAILAEADSLMYEEKRAKRNATISRTK